MREWAAPGLAGLTFSSIELYCKAQALASHIVEEKQSSSYHKMQSRIVRLELAAMASSLLAVVCSVKVTYSQTSHCGFVI